MKLFMREFLHDKDYTKLSDQVSQNIVPLNLNGNSSCECTDKSMP